MCYLNMLSVIGQHAQLQFSPDEHDDEWREQQGHLHHHHLNASRSTVQTVLPRVLRVHHTHRCIGVLLALTNCSFPVPSKQTLFCIHVWAGGECLQHGYVLNARYQVVYPFPTFQPALQLKKDQVILLNTSYSLVACAISLCSGKPPVFVHSSVCWVVCVFAFSQCDLF